MTRPITREEALAYQARWKAVAEFEREELRSMTLDEKFRETERLYLMGKDFDDSEERERDEARLRARWKALREALGGM
jgi:hypothetical protein